jgi:putative mRNA 3-end processing factor
MNIGFRNANPSHGSESYYITIEDAIDGQRACLLVDSGPGLRVERDLGSDEYLAGILLTHAHLDHYQTLGENVRDGARIHTSPSTAAIVETVYKEGKRNYDVSGREAVLDALDPIEGWHEIRNDLAVHPIPAGHTPGAVGFVIRILDGSRPVYALTTGDFGFEGVAGYPPLPTTLPVDIDILFVNGAIDNEPTTTEIVTNALTRARDGSTVLVTTGGLSGVEYAYLLGHATERVGNEIPITVVGQIAKLYADLEFDAPHVTPVANFSDPSELLEAGGICLAGPEVPVDGSAKRLFGRIKNDPAATLLQIGSSNEPPIESAGCTVYSYRHTSHPSLESVDRLVDSLVPVHTVVHHGNHNRFKGRYDETFMWTDTTRIAHTLYRDGNWQEPPWIDEEICTLIRESYNRKRGSRLGDIFEESDLGLPELPTPGRETPPDLAASGLAIEQLEPRGAPLAASVSASDGVAEPVPDETSDESVLAVPESEEALEPVEASESTDPTSTSPTEDDIERILARLDEIDERLRGETVRVRAVDAGEGDVLFRALEDVEFDHGEELSISFLT